MNEMPNLNKMIKGGLVLEEDPGDVTEDEDIHPPNYKNEKGPPDTYIGQDLNYVRKEIKNLREEI